MAYGLKKKRLLLAQKYVLLVGDSSSVALIKETLVTYDYW